MIHYMTSNGLGNAWVGNELREILAKGIPVRLHSLHKPNATFFASPDMQRLNNETRCLYPISPMEFLFSVLAAPMRYRRRFLSAVKNAILGPRESVLIRAKSFFHLMLACQLAGRMRGQPVGLIHSQWIHSGGTVAMYAAWLLGVPFSFTGHASDLFRDRAALQDKIKRAAFIVCISKFHEKFYLERGARPAQLRLVYCGIDTSHFSPSGEVGNHEPPHIVSSGRLVEKKGFHKLLDACAELKSRGVHFRCTIEGSGPQLSELNERITALALNDEVSVSGNPLLQEDIPAFMKTGDVYCLSCVWASDNDVDGLPQMLMEAMACGLPAVSTNLVGIPDLIIHEKTGLLAEPGDTIGLADCLERLLTDKTLSVRLAHAGREHVLDTFDLKDCLDPLVKEFRYYLEQS